MKDAAYEIEDQIKELLMQLRHAASDANQKLDVMDRLRDLMSELERELNS